MSSTLSLLKNVAKPTIFAEELGNLGEVPDGWIKLLTNSGAGDQSEITPIKKNLRSTRDMGTTIKELGNRGEFAGLYLTKSDGTPVGIIIYTGEGGKPWRFITPSGESHTRTQYLNRAIPSWKVPQRSYDDPATGKKVWYKPRGQRETVPVKHTDVSLNDLAGLIPFTDGIDLYGMKKDKNRAALQTQRQASRSGMGTDIKQIKQGAAQKFVGNKVNEPIQSLKNEIEKIAGDIRAALDRATDSAASGEYSRRGRDVMSSQQVDQLNTLLYDLSELSRHAKEASEKGVRAGHSYRKGRTYEYDYLVQDLERIKAKLAKADGGGRYENLAKKLIDTKLKAARQETLQ